nr:MAG TPA: hypothetical protein [Caudoviricetes sp.]
MRVSVRLGVYFDAYFYFQTAFEQASIGAIG